MAHHPVFGSNTICNSPNPLLADIILSGFLLPGLLKRGFYTLIENALLPSPTDVGSHKILL